MKCNCKLVSGRASGLNPMTKREKTVHIIGLVVTTYRTNVTNVLFCCSLAWPTPTLVPCCLFVFVRVFVLAVFILFLLL